MVEEVPSVDAIRSSVQSAVSTPNFPMQPAYASKGVTHHRVAAKEYTLNYYNKLLLAVYPCDGNLM